MRMGGGGSPVFTNDGCIIFEKRHKTRQPVLRVSDFLTRSDTNWPVQCQKNTRGIVLHSFFVAKTKTLISFAELTDLCLCFFAWAVIWFSHDVAHVMA